jgi:hypothetical protein
MASSHETGSSLPFLRICGVVMRWRFDSVSGVVASVLAEHAVIDFAFPIAFDAHDAVVAYHDLD